MKINYENRNCKQMMKIDDENRRQKSTMKVEDGEKNGENKCWEQMISLGLPVQQPLMQKARRNEMAIKHCYKATHTMITLGLLVGCVD